MSSNGIVDLDLPLDQAARAKELCQRAVTVDMLQATSLSQPTPDVDGKHALERLLDAGVSAVTQTLAGYGTTCRDAIREINLVYRLLETEPDKTLLVRQSEDILRAKKDGKLGLIMMFQNGSPLEDDWIDLLPMFYRLGVRIIQLTYNEENLLGCGCLEPVDGGLTAYGAQVVRAMNNLGILVDLSHVGYRTALDAIELSRQPVIFSHSCVKALNPHPRNLPDELIRALAEKGGVMGIVAWGVLCSVRPGPVTISHFLDHIDYVADLVGVDHVGIGLDINENFPLMPAKSWFETQYSFMLGGEEDVEGLYWVHDVPNIFRGLVKRGYSDEAILKIMGGNFMRVASQVWDSEK